MKFIPRLVLIFGVLALGSTGSFASGKIAAQRCTTEECACERALKKNTVEALEDFFRKYPHSFKGNSACAAIAMPSTDDVPDPTGQNGNDGSASVRPCPASEG